MPIYRVLLRLIARRRNLSVSQRSRESSSMAHWSATCLSSESSDTNLCVLVDCNMSRYLFNCAEGTTRMLLQRKKGFRKFTTLFTTGINTDRSSGLAGLLMTIADSGCSKLNVYGPLGLNHYLASTRLYSMRESLSLKSHEIVATSSSPVYVDENLSVFALPVFPHDDDHPSTSSSDQFSLKRKQSHSCASSPDSNKKTKLDTDVPDPIGSLTDDPSLGSLGSILWNSGSVSPSNLTGDQAALWRRLVVQHAYPGNVATTSSKSSTATAATKHGLGNEPSGRKDLVTMRQLNKPLPRMTHESCAVSYIVLGAPGRGKFDAARAEALGLKNGPLRGRLAKGETIVTNEGKVITPDMVVGPAPRPDAMILIDCPSPKHISGLVDSTAFVRFQHGGEYPIHCMFHLVGPKVLDDARYCRWLETFGDKVHHLVAGPDITPDRIAFTSTAYAQLRLSHLDSELFQVPKYAPASTATMTGTLAPKMEILRHNHFVAMKPAKAPVVPPDDDGLDLFHPAILKGGYDDVTSLLKPKTIELFNQTRQIVASECDKREPQPGDDVTVTPLGTSSAMPSKYRNVSSLLVRVPGSGNILLDCGEGTMGQLRRHLGDQTLSVLRDLRCIFISHIHGDHHMGLARLLSTRRKLDPCCSEPVYIIVNQATLMCLREYSDLEDLGLDDPTTGVRVIHSEHAHWRRRSSLVTGKPQNSTDNEWDLIQSSQSAIRELKSLLKFASIVTVDVRHKGRCYGIVFKHREGWSVVYSGDTRPTDNLVYAGQNATLLIHEATLGDDQAEIAAVKGHSTIGQAIDVAKRMNAKNVLLTHFSNRFPKTPQITNAPTEATDPIIAVAFDHVTVSIGNLWKLNRYLPAIQQSFMDSDDPEDEVVMQTGDAP